MALLVQIPVVVDHEFKIDSWENEHPERKSLESKAECLREVLAKGEKEDVQVHNEEAKVPESCVKR